LWGSHINNFILHSSLLETSAISTRKRLPAKSITRLPINARDEWAALHFDFSPDSPSLLATGHKSQQPTTFPDSLEWFAAQSKERTPEESKLLNLMNAFDPRSDIATGPAEQK
jgi:hypothetical protein